MALASGDVGAYAARVRKLVRGYAPAVLHSNGMKMHVLSAAIRTRDERVVWHVRDFVGERPLMATVLGIASRRVSLAIANSNAVAADVRIHLRGLPVHVIHNAIDTDAFCPVGAAASLDTLAGLPAAPLGTVRVGIVATYARWKGHEVFLSAAKRVLDQRSGPVRFYVVGGPVYETAGSQYDHAELRAIVESLGIASDVGFVPFAREPAAIYRALDVVVHASTRPEPFGRTIVEAMSCGRAVVVAGSGGALELFSDGVDAVRARPNDAALLADAIRDLVRDPERRVRLGAAAHEAALRRFSRSRLAEQVLAAYAGRATPQ
jgi:glycosyltransferase involved in cell wall biosynthesis